MQRDTTGLTAENKELKLKLQAMEQQAHLRDGMRVFFVCVCSPSPLPPISQVSHIPTTRVDNFLRTVVSCSCG